MKLIIRRALTVMLLLITVLLAVPEAQVSAARSDADYSEAVKPDDVVKKSITAYYNASNWGGTTISTDVKCDDIIDFKVTTHGGTMTDGEGKLAFANYATVSIALKTEDESMQIPGTYAKIVSERDYLYNGMHIGKKHMNVIDDLVTLDTMVGYGVILTSVEGADGTREVSEEMYVRYYNDRADGIRITKDGDYHFVILMTIKEGSTKKKIALEYTVPIRTSSYVTDENGDYHVKNAGAYYAPARIDTLNRPDVEIRVNNTHVADGFVMRDVGKYTVEIYGNGFLCEKFNFEIFSTAGAHANVYLSNVRAHIDDISYECENNFKVTWYCGNDAEMTYWRDNDPDTVYPYTAGTVITDPGHYVFTLNVPSLANEKQSFLVKLVPNDEPSLNYSTLYQNRFNNFRSKWYEVYDAENGLYYCFAMSEYVKAYDAAMTVERMSTSDYGHYVLYGGKKYTDKVELTRAMAKAASANVRTVYYDPAAEAIEKYFSDAAFDGTVYLNSDYIFARTSPAETNRVTLTDKDGVVREIDFFTPVSRYNLASGSYTVCEEDIYGNKTEYTVIVDRDVPKLYLNLNGERVEAQSHNVYTARYFALSELIDALDDYALASVTEDATGKTEYFLASECENAVFTMGGTYTVRIYDRNGNSESLMVSIEGERQWALEIGDSATTVMLRGSGTVFDGVLVDGVAREFDPAAGAITFEGEGGIKRITVYTKNSAGERDCVTFTVGESEENTESPSGGSTGNVSGGSESGMSVTALNVVAIVSAVILLIAAAFVITIIWRRR